MNRSMTNCAAGVVAAGASLLVGGHARAGDLVIDDFTAGAFSTVLGETTGLVNLSQSGLPPGSTVGGTRAVWLDSCVAPGELMPVTLDTTAGTFNFGGTPDSTFCEGPVFTYGVDRTFGTPLNLDLTNGTNYVAIDLLLLDSGSPNNWYDPETSPSSVRVTLATATPTHAYQAASITLSPTSTPQTIFIPLSVFGDYQYGTSEGFLWSDIDQITFAFGAIGQGGELVLGGFAFTSVPEPSAACLLLGGIAMLRRRRAI